MRRCAWPSRAVTMCAWHMLWPLCATCWARAPPPVGPSLRARCGAPPRRPPSSSCSSCCGPASGGRTTCASRTSWPLGQPALSPLDSDLPRGLLLRWRSPFSSGLSRYSAGCAQASHAWSRLPMSCKRLPAQPTSLDLFAAGWPLPALICSTCAACLAPFRQWPRQGLSERIQWR